MPDNLYDPGNLNVYAKDVRGESQQDDATRKERERKKAEARRRSAEQQRIIDHEIAHHQYVVDRKQYDKWLLIDEKKQNEQGEACLESDSDLGLKEGRYANSAMDYDLIVSKSESGHYQFSFASLQNTAKAHAKALSDTVKFANARGVGTLTLSFPKNTDGRDIDWHDNKISLRRAKDQMKAVLKTAEKQGTIVKLDSSALKMIRAIRPKEKSRQYEQAYKELQKNQTRVTLISGRDTTAALPDITESLDNKPKDVGAFADEFNQMSADGQKKRVEELEKRVEALEKARDSLEKGIDGFDQRYNHSDADLLTMLKNHKYPDQDQSEHLARIKNRINEVHKPRIEKLRAAIEAEANALDEMRKVVAGEQTLSQEAAHKGDTVAVDGAAQPEKSVTGGPDVEPESESDIPESFFEGEGGVEPEPNLEEIQQHLDSLEAESASVANEIGQQDKAIIEVQKEMESLTSELGDVLQNKDMGDEAKDQKRAELLKQIDEKETRLAAARDKRKNLTEKQNDLSEKKEQLTEQLDAGEPEKQQKPQESEQKPESPTQEHQQESATRSNAAEADTSKQKPVSEELKTRMQALAKRLEAVKKATAEKQRKLRQDLKQKQEQTQKKKQSPGGP